MSNNSTDSGPTNIPADYEIRENMLKNGDPKRGDKKAIENFFQMFSPKSTAYGLVHLLTIYDMFNYRRLDLLNEMFKLLKHPLNDFDRYSFLFCIFYCIPPSEFRELFSTPNSEGHQFIKNYQLRKFFSKEMDRLLQSPFEIWQKSHFKGNHNYKTEIIPSPVSGYNHIFEQYPIKTTKKFYHYFPKDLFLNKDITFEQNFYKSKKGEFKYRCFDSVQNYVGRLVDQYCCLLKHTENEKPSADVRKELTEFLSRPELRENSEFLCNVASRLILIYSIHLPGSVEKDKAMDLIRFLFSEMTEPCYEDVMNSFGVELSECYPMTMDIFEMILNVESFNNRYLASHLLLSILATDNEDLLIKFQDKFGPVDFEEIVDLHRLVMFQSSFEQCNLYKNWRSFNCLWKLFENERQKTDHHPLVEEFAKLKAALDRNHIENYNEKSLLFLFISMNYYSVQDWILPMVQLFDVNFIEKLFQTCSKHFPNLPHSGKQYVIQWDEDHCKHINALESLFLDTKTFKFKLCFKRDEIDQDIVQLFFSSRLFYRFNNKYDLLLCCCDTYSFEYIFNYDQCPFGKNEHHSLVKAIDFDLLSHSHRYFKINDFFDMQMNEHPLYKFPYLILKHSVSNRTSDNTIHMILNNEPNYVEETRFKKRQKRDGKRAYKS